jgi:hypothetical protein
MQILTPKDWNEARDPYGEIKGRIEGAEVEGNPIGGLAVSINPDPWELLETETPNS